MADNNVKKWYVVRAVSGQENKVKAYIETEINRLGMSDYVSQVLVPTEKVVQVRDGKKIAKDKVYFPVRLPLEPHTIFSHYYLPFQRNYDFIKLKIPAIAFAHISSTPHVAKAKTTEKTATIIVRRCTSDHSGQVTFVFNSSNASDI